MSDHLCCADVINVNYVYKYLHGFNFKGGGGVHNLELLPMTMWMSWSSSFIDECEFVISDDVNCHDNGW